MNAGVASAEAALLAVEGDYPGWHAWLSSSGRWWATRTGAGAQGEFTDGRPSLPMTVDADDEAGLREALEPYRDAA